MISYRYGLDAICGEGEWQKGYRFLRKNSTGIAWTERFR